jgi:hypothetical protein
MLWMAGNSLPRPRKNPFSHYRIHIPFKISKDRSKTIIAINTARQRGQARENFLQEQRNQALAQQKLLEAGCLPRTTIMSFFNILQTIFNNHLPEELVIEIAQYLICSIPWIGTKKHADTLKQMIIAESIKQN